MNLSGESIRLVMDYYNIDVEDVLIIYDDLALPLGKLRLRQQGSPGGHNGIKSIISNLGTKEFQRIRIGIDSNPFIDAKDYVLGKFSKEEKKELKVALEKATEIIGDFKNDKEFSLIMNNYN
jgi:PTH1 family peptidyl-tRNA hydrolase